MPTQKSFFFFKKFVFRKWDCKNIVDHMHDNSVHSISCTTQKFIVLQPGEGDSFIRDAQIVARTHGSSFKNLYFKITLNSKKNFFVRFYLFIFFICFFFKY